MTRLLPSNGQRRIPCQKKELADHNRNKWLKAVMGDIKVTTMILNIAALMAPVKGSSNSHSLDQMAKIVHLACFAIRTVPYFEYIESKANWADEVSRAGTQGTWAPRNAFPVKECGVLAELLTLPCIAVIMIFEYL